MTYVDPNWAAGSLAPDRQQLTWLHDKVAAIAKELNRPINVMEFGVGKTSYAIYTAVKPVLNSYTAIEAFAPLIEAIKTHLPEIRLVIDHQTKWDMKELEKNTIDICFIDSSCGSGSSGLGRDVNAASIQPYMKNDGYIILHDIYNKSGSGPKKYLESNGYITVDKCDIHQGIGVYKMPIPIIQRGYLEHLIVTSCNLKCQGCTIDVPNSARPCSDIEIFQKDLRALAKVMRIKQFRMVGGEPLLDKRLPEFLKIARDVGMFEKIGICTNGLLLEKMPDELFLSLDYIDVSIYPNVQDGDKIDKFLQDKSQSFKFAYKLKNHLKFRHTLLDHDQSEEDTKHVYEACAIAHQWGCHTFYDGMYYKCSKPTIQIYYDAARGIKREYRPAGISIHDPDLFMRLTTYISDYRPMDHCRSCLGTSGGRFRHYQQAPK